MHVRFKYDWFGPDSRRYRKCGKTDFREVPDELRDQLPSTAVILDNDETAELEKAAAEAEEAAKTVDPRQFDDALAAAEEEERVQKEADARAEEIEWARRERAEAFQRQLKEEQKKKVVQRDATSEEDEAPKKRGPGRPRKRSSGRPRKKG